MLFFILRTRQNLGLAWSFLSFLLPPSPIILNGLDVFYGCTKRPFHLCKVCALDLAQTRKLTETELLFLEKTAVYHLLPHLPLRSLPFQSTALKEFDRNQFCVSRKWSTCFFQRKLLFIFFFFPCIENQMQKRKTGPLFDTLEGLHVRFSFTKHVCNCTSYLFSLCYNQSTVKWKQKLLLSSYVCCEIENSESLSIAVEIIHTP